MGACQLPSRSWGRWASPPASSAAPARPDSKTAVAAADPNTPWYAKPAADWEQEALPIGNGAMGAMVSGGVGEEKLQFNEKTLWTGGPGSAGYNFGNWNSPRPTAIQEGVDTINTQGKADPSWPAGSQTGGQAAVAVPHRRRARVAGRPGRLPLHRGRVDPRRSPRPPQTGPRRGRAAGGTAARHGLPPALGHRLAHARIRARRQRGSPPKLPRKAWINLPTPGSSADAPSSQVLLRSAFSVHDQAE
ncbi:MULTISPECIES: glycoside hydrolase N-terminal domain-containing protein [Streptomyces violaceusniger group]